MVEPYIKDEDCYPGALANRLRIRAEEIDAVEKGRLVDDAIMETLPPKVRECIQDVESVYLVTAEEYFGHTVYYFQYDMQSDEEHIKAGYPKKRARKMWACQIGDLLYGNSVLSPAGWKSIYKNARKSVHALVGKQNGNKYRYIKLKYADGHKLIGADDTFMIKGLINLLYSSEVGKSLSMEIVEMEFDGPMEYMKANSAYYGADGA